MTRFLGPFAGFIDGDVGNTFAARVHAGSDNSRLRRTREQASFARRARPWRSLRHTSTLGLIPDATDQDHSREIWLRTDSGEALLGCYSAFLHLQQFQKLPETVFLVADQVPGFREHPLPSPSPRPNRRRRPLAAWLRSFWLEEDEQVKTVLTCSAQARAADGKKWSQPRAPMRVRAVCSRCNIGHQWSVLGARKPATCQSPFAYSRVDRQRVQPRRILAAFRSEGHRTAG